MGIDVKTMMKNTVRVGVVSAINAENMTARVDFEDMDNIVSAELPILNRGSKKVKDYWIPDIGEQVVCLFSSRDTNTSIGWIIGTHFSAADTPNAADANIRRVDFGDGSYIEYDRGSQSMTINCAGPLTIKGSTVNIN